jgi:arsenite-transporting ATPase
LPSHPAAPNPAARPARFRFVGGKGGVGKTTCAAALGIASARRGQPTLLISTDPAPSLGDALGQRLGPAPRPVRGVRGLHAVEVDARAAIARWIDARRDTLERMALRGTWLDSDDVARLLRLSLPGIDEVAGLLEVLDLGGGERYAQVIIDAAPTGHLLRMLGMPATLDGLARVFDHMQAKHRIIVDALRGSYTPDAADLLIGEIAERGRELHGLLRDPARTVLSWVTVPEPMAVEETRDGLAWLRQQGMSVDRVIVNRLTPAPPARCGWCSARRQSERRAVAALLRAPEVRGLRVLPLGAAAVEPRGVRALSAMGAELERARPVARPARTTRPAAARASLPAGVSSPARLDEAAAATLVLFGGKGGVGKTTCAAALALHAAAVAPERRVLLLSVDPAHSLADVLGQECPDTGRRLERGPPNLLVRELDASRAFAGVRERVTGAIEALFSPLSAAGPGGVAVAQQDRQVMADLLELAPPGVDELVSIMEIAESVLEAPRRFDLAILDTAPTGHALRLIEMPALVHEWVRAVMAIILKYQPAVGVGALGAELLRLSQGLGQLRKLMADPRRTRFITVTRAANLPRAETRRLLARLQAAGVSAPLVVVNAAGAGTCSRCRAEQAAQQAEIARLRRALRRRSPAPAVVLAPAALPPPHGPARLRAWIRGWREVTGAARR